MSCTEVCIAAMKVALHVLHVPSEDHETTALLLWTSSSSPIGELGSDMVSIAL